MSELYSKHTLPPGEQCDRKEAEWMLVNLFREPCEEWTEAEIVILDTWFRAHIPQREARGEFWYGYKFRAGNDTGLFISLGASPSLSAPTVEAMCQKLDNFWQKIGRSPTNGTTTDQKSEGHV